jgi:hypothetical protein
MEPPETRFAKTPEGLSVAYQVVGEGQRDILLLQSVNAIDAAWFEPS